MKNKVLLYIPLMLLINLLSNINSYAQNNSLQFKYLSFKDGLQNITIHSIVQDYEGFVWIGTEDGLHKYDGYEFTVYYNNRDDTNSLKDNNVNEIIEDEEKNLWIGTNTGLDLYNRIKNSFIHIPLIEERITGATINYFNYNTYYINYLYKDKENNIFVGTRNQTLYKLDIKNRCIRPFIKNIQFNENLVRSSDSKGNIWISSMQGAYKFNIHNYKTTHFFYKPNDSEGLASNQVFFIHVDNYDNVWITNNEGLNKIDAKTQRMKFYKHDPNNPFSISNHFIKQIFEDRFNNLWFCTDNGLYKYDRDKDNFNVYKNNVNDETSLSSNMLNCAYVDKQGILWIGTQTKGINYTQLFNSYNFLTVRINSINITGLQNSPVTAIYKDDANNLWIGTDGGGLCCFNNKRNQLKYYNHDALNPNTISTNSVLTILQDSKGDMWFGGYYGGICKFNKKNETFETYKLEFQFPVSIRNLTNDIKSMLEDNEGNIIIASNGGGIIIFDKENKTFRHILNDPDSNNSLCSNWCTTLYKDSEGFIWVGTYYGLSKWDIRKKYFTNYYHNETSNSSISSNVVYSVLEDTKHNIWIGTTKGLSQFNKATNNFSNYTRKDGLPNEVINAIMEDKDGNLWISTFKGLSKLDIITKKFKNYTDDFGLQGNQFINGSYFKDKKGEMYFGCMDGFTKFIPENVKDNKYFPPIYITEFQILNKPVRVGEKDSILSKPISETRRIKLKYNQSFISFKYVALNFIHPNQTKYAYMMEGFDKDWHYVGYERIATYTNLNPGEYVFKIKACNNDGYWYETGSSIRLIIKPPIWRTTIAYILYLLLAGIILLGIIKFFRFKDKIKHQLEIQRIEAEEQHKLDMLKLRFFTNISHELRTPLTLILGPAERIMENLRINAPIALQLAETIWRNSNRLLKLVNQLLDFRKIDSGLEKINLVETDIVKFISDLFDLFRYQAEYKGINFIKNITAENLITCFDPDKIEKVVYNLLSNSIKYTPDKGSVKLTISETQAEDELKVLMKGALTIEKAVKIEVSDNGIGISSDEKEKVFNPFYQVNQKKLNKSEGSGIGLSIVREYVKLHNGEILIKDNAQYNVGFKVGTTFVIYLPVIRADNYMNLVDADIISNIQKVNLSRIKDFLPEAQKKEIEFEASVNNSEFFPVILIIEDNAEMRSFLKSELINQFKIIEASDGKDGYALAIKEIPDLIISDIMMTEVTGIELCKQIKTDLRTSHIPVILLTALSEDEYKIEGLETGADEYLTKPFKIDILLVRIKNLIETRKLLQEKFSRSVSLNKVDIRNSTDQKFIEEIFSIVEKNMQDPKFGIELFTRAVGMSRTQLYKKIKAISGQTVFELIYTIRLKKAAEILLNENIAVSEVAIRVGYTNHSVFTRSFTKQFKINPSKYAEFYGPRKGNPE